MATFCLSQNHWSMEHFTERITTQEWKQCLLSGQDIILFRGNIRKLQAKNLGYGVVEISKVPLEAQKGTK